MYIANNISAVTIIAVLVSSVIGENNYTTDRWHFYYSIIVSHFYKCRPNFHNRMQNYARRVLSQCVYKRCFYLSNNNIYDHEYILDCMRQISPIKHSGYEIIVESL